MSSTPSPRCSANNPRPFYCLCLPGTTRSLQPLVATLMTLDPAAALGEPPPPLGEVRYSAFSSLASDDSTEVLQSGADLECLGSHARPVACIARLGAPVLAAGRGIAA
eukprot:IDg22622t1